MNKFTREWVDANKNNFGEPSPNEELAIELQEQINKKDVEIERLQSRIAELEAELKKPIIRNCLVNGEGIKEGWSLTGNDDKSIIRPQPPKEEE